MTKYRQCILENYSMDGVERVVGWVDDKEAKVGNRVKTKRGFWFVQTLGERTLTLFENKSYVQNLEDIIVNS